MTRWPVVIVLGIAAAVGFASQAHAEDPWSAGISDEDKATAQHLLEQGNALFLAKKYGEALESYRRALASWDHPAIRFNIVRCLIQLERPVEASDNLERALAYGVAPLGESLHAEALAYQKLLANQIGVLAVGCTQRGARVTLDGKELGTCPFAKSSRVTPGRHQVAGQAPGFLTRTIDVVVIGRTRQDVAVTLVPLEQAAKVVHRWPTWKPWAVFVGGLASTGVGAVLQFKAASDMNSYERQLANECTGGGCTGEQEAAFSSLESNAVVENRVGLVFIVAGAAATIAGSTMLYLNRAQTVYPSATVSESGTSVSLTGHF